jgi:hypothetical protein
MNLSQRPKSQCKSCTPSDSINFFIPLISFHLIDLHDNKENAIFFNEIFFKKKKKHDRRLGLRQ